MRISLEKTIRAMSIALDLAEISSITDVDIIEKVSNINYSEHKFLHHSRRTAYIALELAKVLKISGDALKELYISALLHDIGATDSLKKSHHKDSFIKEHCLNGSFIISTFPTFSNMSDIILFHHENFDGSGPMSLSGNEIPVTSQIIRISDLIELLYDDKTPAYKQKDKIVSWIKSHNSIIFSNELVSSFLAVSHKDEFWLNVENIGTLDFILDKNAPELDIYLDLKQFEKVAFVFSKIIDSKSGFTAMHSRNIAELAFRVAKYLNYSEEECLKMKIAGLLHDIGKLAIPSSVLDKNASLTNDEFSVIKSHVYYTKIILDKIGGMNDISNWASNHHEKLNGRGYPRSLNEKDLTQQDRILGVCDIYQALTEDRPYRKGLDREKAFSIMNTMVNDGFICSEAVNSLQGTLDYMKHSHA